MSPSNKSYFNSWIPTLIGRLSFSAANPLQVGKVYFQYSNLTSGGQSFVAAVEWLNSDLTIPILSSSRRSRALLERFLVGNSTRFVFVAAFRVSDDFEFLRGTVKVFDHKDWVKNEQRIRRAGKDIYDVLSHSSAELDAENFLSELTNICDVGYLLRRNGLIEISSIKMSAPTRDSLTQHSEDADEAIAYFVYHFLRELFHTHKYHSPDSDTVLTVYNEKWEDHISAALLRKIIVLRRIGDIDSINKASGIVEYLSTFCMKVRTRGSIANSIALNELRNGLDVDRKIAIQRSFIPFWRKAGIVSRYLSGACIALIAYLRLNYDISLEITGVNPDILLDGGFEIVRQQAIDKAFLIDTYLRFADEIVVSAGVLFFISIFLRFDIEFVKNSYRDILRFAITNRRISIVACFFLLVSGLFGFTLFIVMVF